MSCGITNRRRVVPWAPPSQGILKFNVNGAARGKLGPTGIGRVLRDDRGVVLCLEALGIFSRSFHRSVLVESDSLNAIS